MRKVKILKKQCGTVTSKGQLVIPADIRRRYHIERGTRVAFLEDHGRLYVQPVTDEFIADMRGILVRLGVPADTALKRDKDRELA